MGNDVLDAMAPTPEPTILFSAVVLATSVSEVEANNVSTRVEWPDMNDRMRVCRLKTHWYRL